MSKILVDTIDTRSGTTNLTIGSTNSSTVTFENGAVTGHMYPAFTAQLTNNATVSIPNATMTKVSFGTEIFDAGSVYDTSNSRFTPGIAGHYYVFSRLSFNTDADFDDIRLQIHKNGTRNNSMLSRNEYYNQIYIFDVLTLNTTDYLEIHAYQDSGSSRNILTNEDGRRGCFGAYRIGS